MRKRKKRTQDVAGAVDGCHTRERPKEDTGNRTKYTIEEVLAKVEEYMENFNFELAEKFSNRALEISPDNPRALTLSASVFLEVGKSEKAADCVKHAIEIEPDEGPTKYMILGQLLEGEQAAECFKKGIHFMIAEKEMSEKESSAGANTTNSVSKEVTDRDISSAFCSLAEIYLTDCCYSEDAEVRCEEYCKKAIEHDPTNPDAYQVMANFLLSEEKIKEAKDMLMKSLNLWESYDDSSMKAIVPSYESRMSLSKMLIEVEEYENACNLLERLLQEDDEVVQVWYLLGWVHHLGGEDSAAVKYYLEKAKQLFTQVECDDEPLLEHIEELLKVNEQSLTTEDVQDNDEDEEMNGIAEDEDQ